VADRDPSQPPPRPGTPARRLIEQRVLGTLAAAVLLYALIRQPAPVLGADVCVFHRLTQLPCAGCGLTRGVISLMHGRWTDAWNFHPFAYLAVPAFLYLAVGMVFPRPVGAGLAWLFGRRAGLAVVFVLMLAFVTWGIWRIWCAAHL
jgi:hypothetical protein